MAGTASVPNTFVAATDAVAAEVNANFESLRDFINDNMVHKDGTTTIAPASTQTINGGLTVTGTLTLSGNLNASASITGDIVASNGTSIVLNNGTNGSDATFKGDIQNASGTTIVDVSAATSAGNASTATTLAATKNIDVTGVTATAAAFDGSANVEIEVTAVPSSLLTGTIDVARVPDLEASKIDAGTFGTGDYTFPGALTVNGLLDVSSQAKIEFGNANDQIRFDDTANEYQFWADGNKLGTLGSPSIRMHNTGGTLIADSPPSGTGNDAEWAVFAGTNVLYQNTSVAADKENISADLGTHLTAAMIDSVVPKIWNRITAPGIPEIGPIADEIDEVSPFLAAHGTDANDDQILTGVNKTGWMSLMTLAIQDLRDRMEAVEAA
ncbi:MAG: hypothetical protein L7S55_11060 [Luminiphilus sp.]|nr:hypothetical protein [Luminiphilus sp.]